MVSSVPNIGFDKLFLSGWQAQMKSAARDLQTPQVSQTQPSSETSQGSQDRAAPSSSEAELSLQQQQLLDDLVATDRKVRAHEQAHLNVGRDLIVSGPVYNFEKGPDGRSYAVAGEVQIDTSPAKTPEETVPKAQRIRATALAPADPSAQDQQVASRATSLEMNARVEMALAQREGGSSRQGVLAVRAYERTQTGRPGEGLSVLA